MIREEVEDMKKEVEGLQEERSLAMTLLHELKVSSKRWFIAWLITVIALVGSNIGWLIYESQWETVETSTMELLQEDVNSSNQSGVIN